MEATRGGRRQHRRHNVSIHASVMEATRPRRPSPPWAAGFDPRLRDGGDGPAACRPPRCRCFDPRLRDGGDKIDNRVATWARSFDPRLRDGGDPIVIGDMPEDRRFDPRLRDGGDGSRRAPGPRNPVSIHASVMEATAASAIPSTHALVSIHASVMEATLIPTRESSQYRFRSTPP